MKLGSCWVVNKCLNKLQYSVSVVLGLESVSTIYKVLKCTVMRARQGISVKTKELCQEDQKIC